MSGVWVNIFWVCFLVGLILTGISLLFGELGHHGFGFGHHHLDFGGHDGAGGGGDGHVGHHGVPWLNYHSIVVFLLWFGLVGVILSQGGKLSLIVTLLSAVGAGVVGAAIIFVVFSKFLWQDEKLLDEVDYYMPGTLARVSSSIRLGGVGEIVYVQGGTRKTAGARSEEGAAHKQGEEVVIVRYEKGIAYVKAIGDTFDLGEGREEV